MRFLIDRNRFPQRVLSQLELTRLSIQRRVRHFDNRRIQIPAVVPLSERECLL